MDFGTYQPRRQTHAEAEAAEEMAEKRRWHREMAVQKEQQMSRSSTARIAQNGDIQYRDFDLGRSAAPKTRTELDNIAYKDRKVVLPLNRLRGVSSLGEIARHVATSNFDAALETLDFCHRFHARSMLNDISQRMDGQIPFATWLAFASRIPLDDIPKNRRTYRGLVLADMKELLSIREANEESLEQWREEMADIRGQSLPLPSFFLGILDLSNDQTLRDSDVWKFRSTIAPFLVSLNLSSTQLTDAAISTMASGYGQQDAYKTLEVLVLHHVSFTDAIAKKLARFTKLRMLDVRNTKCSRHFMSSLNADASPAPAPWECATRRKNSQASLLEFQLFGPSYSPSHVITLLQELATWIHDSPSTKSLHLEVVKPLFVHIDCLVRAAARSKATGVGESLFSMTRETEDATTAYHKTYGGVFSSVPLARGQLEEDGANEKGGRSGGRDDGIATGGYSGVGREGGRVSLYDIGMRKVAPSSGGAWSDGGSDGEMEEEVEYERKLQEQAMKPGFYREPIPRPERKIVVADYSTFMLLRHLPLPDHTTYLPQSFLAPTPIPVSRKMGFSEGSQVAIKLKRPNPSENCRPIDELLTQFASSFSRSARKRPRPTEQKVQPTKPTQGVNPFAKSARSTVKPVVKRAGALEQKKEGVQQRHELAAFRKR